MVSENLPTRAEQWATYDRARAAWRERMQAWRDGGEQGPPPPMPVRPHTPGWLPAREVPSLPLVTESGEFPPPVVPTTQAPAGAGRGARG